MVSVLDQLPLFSRTLERQFLSVSWHCLWLTSLHPGNSGDRCLPLRVVTCVEPRGSQGNMQFSAGAHQVGEVHSSLKNSLPLLEWKHVHVCLDNSLTAYHVNHQRGTKSSQSLWES